MLCSLLPSDTRDKNNHNTHRISEDKANHQEQQQNKVMTEKRSDIIASDFVELYYLCILHRANQLFTLPADRTALCISRHVIELSN